MRALHQDVRSLGVTVLATALVLGGTVAGAPAGSAAPASLAPHAVPVAAAWAARPADPIAHDPTMATEGAYHYLVTTGDAQRPNTYLPIKRSTDLVHWEDLGPVFRSLPAWVSEQLGTTPADAWAPSLARVGGRWLLYYSVSQFGTQNSLIGLATSPTLDPTAPGYDWSDQGMVLRSTPGVDDFNAIDPGYVADDQGGAWLVFGSFWGGIKLRRLDPATGKPSGTDTTVRSLASRVAPDAEEAPAVVRHDGYYYLFLSFDYCCRAGESDYRMMVGRSTTVTGPYVDRAGVPLTSGGGTEVLRGYHEFVGTGSSDLSTVDSPAGPITLLVNHYYDGTDGGAPRLNVRPVSWQDAWPVVGDPLNPSRSVGHGDAYVRLIERTSGRPVTNVGCGYEGADIVLGTDAPNDSCQQWQYTYRGEGTSALLNRFSNKVIEVAACANMDGGRVAQWGWIGFLPSNDCQRWRAAPPPAGWTRLQTVLPGSRALDVARCAGGSTDYLVVESPKDGACQQFRFEPVGSVLMVHQGPAPGVLCHDTSGWPPLGAACPRWRFTSAGGAEYTITEALTGLPLGVTDCPRDIAGTQPRLLPAADRACRRWTRWTLVPGSDGTWILTLVGTPITRTVALELP
jgi:arabinan endo-1,5-alpha-L-arabinosidase